MKRLQSEVKAASEKQQTDAHHRENEGERWRRRETDSERHLAEDNLISTQKENTATHTRPAHLKLHYTTVTYSGLLWLKKHGALMRI